MSEAGTNDVKRVLVVEDDPTVQTLVKAILTKNGYDVSAVDTAEEGEKLANDDSYEIIVLDLRLPDGNGYDICYNIRNDGVTTPVLFLSAEHETDVKIKCLKVGADDYLTKPFNSEELLARIEAITRRSSPKGVDSELTCEDLIKVDLVSRHVFVNSSEVNLTNNEFNLLVYFMKNRNRVISQEELAKNVWDIHFDTQTNYINVYISYLRKKIREKVDGEFIETVRKKGFIFNCPEGQE
ncbi:MAG: response regulator transcription factor [Balneolaceae bacterium]